jgi:hypothetical protein
VFRANFPRLCSKIYSTACSPSDLNFYKPTGFACADFTGSGKQQIALAVPEWPCHACNDWLIFERTNDRWNLIFDNNLGLCIIPTAPRRFSLITQETTATDSKLHGIRSDYEWNGQTFDLVNESVIPNGLCGSTKSDVAVREAASEKREVGRNALSGSFVFLMPPLIMALDGSTYTVNKSASVSDWQEFGIRLYPTRGVCEHDIAERQARVLIAIEDHCAGETAERSGFRCAPLFQLAEGKCFPSELWSVPR